MRTCSCEDCAGNTESFLRAGHPTAADIILDTLSIDYHETLMAAAGHRAEQALEHTVEAKRGAVMLDSVVGGRGLLHRSGRGS